MGKASNYFPPVGTFHHKWYPDEVVSLGDPLSTGRIWYVNGNLSTGGAGRSWADGYATIQEAVTAASAGDVIYIAEKTAVALAVDPTSYAETVIIPYTKPNLSLIGVSRGRTQGGLPQVRMGAGSTALLNIKAPGCLIANLGFNGISSTGGGIKLSDDGTDPATTATSFGTTIVNCHFKNCFGSTSTDAKTGGAVYTSSNGGAWQLRVAGCRFYKCFGGIIVIGTGGSVPQDWIIEDNVFGSSANTEVDADIYVGGSGVKGIVIRDNYFATVDGCAGTSGTVQHYIELAAGSFGLIAGNTFACKSHESDTPMTFGSSTHTACKIPTTVRMANNWGEMAMGGAAGDCSNVYRTD